MRADSFSRAFAWGAFASVCAGPFLFGAVNRSVWIPMCQLWLLLGFVSAGLRNRSLGGGGEDAGLSLSRALLPLHAYLALQLIPMPASVLAILSPGSFAAHFLPDPGDGRFRPLSVSPGASIEAWLYFAGLQGLFLSLQGISLKKRRSFLYGLLGVIMVLAGEGLWQSRSAHPFWLYGFVPVFLPSGLETSVFGPYLNRNHFATLMAIGSGLAAGIAATLARGQAGLASKASAPALRPGVVLSAGASLFLAITCAASGSRSGALAAILAVGLIAARTLSFRVLMAALALGVGSVALTSSAVLDRLMRLDIHASRWLPWVDMSNLLRFFPVFGSGAGTFGVAYWPYQKNASYEFWSHAHNEYLQWLIEGGLVGVLVLYWTVRRCLGALRFSPDTREAALGAVTAFSVQAALDFPFHIPANAAILISVLALTTRPHRLQPPETPSR